MNTDPKFGENHSIKSPGPQTSNPEDPSAGRHTEFIPDVGSTQIPMETVIAPRNVTSGSGNGGQPPQTGNVAAAAEFPDFSIPGIGSTVIAVSSPQPESPVPSPKGSSGAGQDVIREPVTDPTILGAAEQVNLPGPTIIGDPGKGDLEDLIDTVAESETEGQSSGRRGYLVGNYQILGELGRGGMGVVYKARHRTLNRIVALKMILGGTHASRDVLERFVGEARAVASLQHSGIVQIFEIDEHQGLPYFSLEFVEGTDLQKDLNGLPREPRRCAEMVASLCDAMQYAHDHKLLHRDLKPSNILLDPQGKPKITDFGLAKIVDAAGSGATSEGTVMGSPSYMPPEQARGELSSISPRSDLYSLGAILYQMLTARPPFVGERPLDTIMQVIRNEPVSPRLLQPSVPVDLETICLKAMQKEAGSRYASCAEMAADLRRYLNGEPILARPVSTAERMWRWCRRNPKIAVPSLLAGFFITATAVIATWAWSATAAQAQVIAEQRDNVRKERDNVQKERDNANQQRDIADEQRALAVANKDKAQKEKEEADRQRILAVEARRIAEQNRARAIAQANLALKNIQFMLTEVDTLLTRQTGSEPLRIQLLQTLEKNFEQLDVELTGGEVDGQAIATLMLIWFKIADVWVSLDKTPNADTRYASLYEKGHERLLLKNRNDATRYNLAQICRRWAPVKAKLSGSSDDEDRLLNEGLELIREVFREPHPSDEGNPKPYELKRVLASCLLDKGLFLKRQGQIESADAALREAGQVCEQQLQEMGESPDWLMALPETERSLAQKEFQQRLELIRTSRVNLLFRLGRSEEATAQYQPILDSRRKAAAGDSPAPLARQNLAITLFDFGQQLLRAGQADPAAAALAEAVELFEKLDAAANPAIRRAMATSQYYLGVAREAQGQKDQALSLFERSRLVRAEILAANPQDQANQVNLMLSAARAGDLDTAQKLAGELSAREARNPDLQLDLARTYAHVILLTEGDAQIAAREAALTALERCADEGYADAWRIRGEHDLIPIRMEPRYEAAVARIDSTSKSPQAK